MVFKSLHEIWSLFYLYSDDDVHIKNESNILHNNQNIMKYFFHFILKKSKDQKFKRFHFLITEKKSNVEYFAYFFLRFSYEPYRSEDGVWEINVFLWSSILKNLMLFIEYIS